MDYYSTIKNEILPFVTAWMDPESIMLSEKSQREQHKYCMISLICATWKTEQDTGTSLAVQWLRLHASTARVISSITGRGIKIPHAAGHGQKKTQNKCTNEDKLIDTETMSGCQRGGQWGVGWTRWRGLRGGIVNKAEIDVFLELSCFFDDPADVGNMISASSALPLS